MTIDPRSIGNPETESREGRDLDDVALTEILNTYRTQVEIPPEHPSCQFLLCPIGLVGAGKTTVLKPLANHFHLVRISNDEIRGLLKKYGYNLIRTVELAFQFISECVKKGHSIAIDADCAGPNVSKTIREFIDAHKLKVVWIHINPPESFILNKLRTFKHTWLFKNADEAVQSYLNRKHLHEKLDLPFLYEFDTSKENLPEQIKEAESRIEKFITEPYIASLV